MSSLLDTKETSLHPKATYRESLLDGCMDEFVATFNMYADVDGTELTQRAEKLYHCREQAWFIVNKHDRKVGIASNACRLKWCPLCSKSKANYVAECVHLWLKSIKEPKFLTLTLKHSDAGLVEQVKRLYSSFRELRRIKYIKKAMRGGIWFFQITYNKKFNQWHPHLHIVLDSSYMPQSFLSQTWKRITTDSVIVDIRTVLDLANTAWYVSRYVARPCKLVTLSKNAKRELFFDLHHRRLCGTFGNAKGTKLSGHRPFVGADWISAGRYEFHVQWEKYGGVSRELFHCHRTGEPLSLESFAKINGPIPQTDSVDPFIQCVLDLCSKFKE